MTHAVHDVHNIKVYTATAADSIAELNKVSHRTCGAGASHRRTTHRPDGCTNTCEPISITVQNETYGNSYQNQNM